MAVTTRDSDWQIRLFVYETLIATGAAPSLAMLAERFGLSLPDARHALRRLHDAHALVLQAGSDEILMAHPLSATPTDYRVIIDDVALYANCAWDSLGIPAMLNCDAQIEARHPLGEEAMRYRIAGGELQNSEDRLVHFAHPFRQWYDDIVDT